MSNIELQNNYLENIGIPNFLDGAKVLKWAWSGLRPFGYIMSIIEKEEVYGIAICQYDGDKNIYRFCCNKNWEPIQDDTYDSIQDAIEHLPHQYKDVEAIWKNKHHSI